MRVGIVLPSYMYSVVRKKLATDAFFSLANTEPLKDESTLFLLVRRGTAEQYQVPMESLSRKFRVILKTDEGLEGTEQTLAYGTDWLFENMGVHFVTWMGDDALFHPMWLWQLEKLIRRRPTAKSWSVYRSSYEFVHQTIQEDVEDVLVRSICGHGMTISKKEWKDWGINWKTGSWTCNQGDTLDLVHSEERPGQRWVTKKSYVQHTAPHCGVHCTESTPEYAKDFETV